LAKKAGLERKTINRIENGHFSPSLQSLILLCGALKVKPSDVLEGI
jgi:DNA-binding XRE family transcriptional regulator